MLDHHIDGVESYTSQVMISEQYVICFSLSLGLKHTVEAKRIIFLLTLTISTVCYDSVASNSDLVSI